MYFDIIWQGHIVKPFLCSDTSDHVHFRKCALVGIAVLLVVAVQGANSQTTHQISDSEQDAHTQFVQKVFSDFIPNHGGSIIVVKNGTEMIMKHHGTVAIDSTEAITSDTAFRSGTMGEIIIAILALDLYEQGKLNLSEPINTYLNGTGVSIINPFEQNVTAEMLLTHRSGLESIFLGNLVFSEKELVPLETLLKARKPKVVWEPGRLVSNSPMDYTLLAFVIEQIVGQDFQNYAQATFFNPLGLVNSGIAPGIDGNKIAKEYAVGGQIISRGYYNLYPSFGFYTTPLDLLKLMKILQQPTMGILNASTAALVRTGQWRISESTTALTYGLAEKQIFGNKVIMKAGGTRGATTVMYWDPVTNTSIAAWINIGDYKPFFRLIEDYWQVMEPDRINQPLPVLADDIGFFSIRRYVGTYWDVTFIRSTLEKSLKLSLGVMNRQVPQEIHVGEENDTLVTEIRIGDQSYRDVWYLVNETTFVHSNSTEYLVFIEQSGEVFLYITLWNMPTYFERIPFVQAVETQYALLGFALGVFMVSFLAVFMVPDYRNKYLDRRIHFIDRFPYSIIVQSSMLNIIFPFVFESALGFLDPGEFTLGLPLLIRLILLIPILSVFFFLGFIAYLWVQRKEIKTRRDRLFFLTYVLGNIVYFYVLNDVRLIGYYY